MTEYKNRLKSAKSDMCMRSFKITWRLMDGASFQGDSLPESPQSNTCTYLEPLDAIGMSESSSTPSLQITLRTFILYDFYRQQKLDNMDVM